MSGGKEDKSIPHRKSASLGSLRQAHVLRSDKEAGAESSGLWVERDQRQQGRGEIV